MKKVEKKETSANVFINKFINAAEGDDLTTLAAKTWRSVKSALDSHVAAFKYDLIELEDAVTVAKESFEGAKINYSSPLSSRELYVEILLEAKNTLSQKELDLEHHKITITFLEEILEELSE